jgi:hypothetical protein
MSVITFPSYLYAAQVDWGQLRNDMESRSLFGAQAVEVSVPLWTAKLTAPLTSEDTNDATSGAWKTLLLSLRGRVNQLALWDIGRPVPHGTMRGTMTLNAAAAQGDVALSIVATGENSKSLLAGDMIGLGSGVTQQVVMVMADATSDGSGIIAVTWNQPKVLFRRADSIVGWSYKDAFQLEGFTINLLEDWRP